MLRVAYYYALRDGCPTRAWGIPSGRGPSDALQHVPSGVNQKHTRVYKVEFDETSSML
jgi:hypothetical protein